MGFHDALRNRLIQSAYLYGTTIRWVERGAKDAPPMIVLNIISDVRDQHLRGFSEARSTRVQADCYAASGDAARALAEQLLTVVALPATQDGVSMTLADAAGPLDLIEESAGTRTMRKSMIDLTIFHNG